MIRMEDRFSLTSFPDYYESSDLPVVVTGRIKEKVRALGSHLPTKTREDVLHIIDKAIELTNLELSMAIDDLWVPQVVPYISEINDKLDSIRLEIRTFCRVGAGLN